jgi:hypothetical protein
MGTIVMGKKRTETDYTGLLTEYDSLRSEILKRQEARLTILGFTMTAVGIILGISFQGSSPFALNSYLAIALGFFALIVIIAALALTIQYTQQNQVIAGYIREYIETKVPLMGYERHWKQYREHHRQNSRIFPMTTSRSLAVVYALLTFAGCFVVGYPIILLDGASVILGLVGLFAFAFSSFYLCRDLFFKKSRGWKVDWSVLVKQETETKNT